MQEIDGLCVNLRCEELGQLGQSLREIHINVISENMFADNPQASYSSPQRCTQTTWNYTPRSSRRIVDVRWTIMALEL